LRHKNKTFHIFKKFKALVENQIGRKIKRIRTNSGVEFCEADFNK